MYYLRARNEINTNQTYALQMFPLSGIPKSQSDPNSPSSLYLGIISSKNQVSAPLGWFWFLHNARHMPLL